MDIILPISENEVEVKLDSPSTLLPPLQHDCEAAVNEPKRPRRS